MAETYCGKNCAECTQRESLNCPGCKAGPGKQITGSCELAKCCRLKGHEECSTCNLNSDCRIYRGRYHILENRLKAEEAEKKRIGEIMRKAPFLGKWLWILFWLFIPSEIASLLANNTLAASLPDLYIPGKVLSAICMLAYGFILIKLASEEEDYRTAGICTLICAAMNGIIAFVSEGLANAPMLLLAILIITSIISVVGEYKAFAAHSEILVGVDNLLSDKWLVLRKWYIGAYCVMIACFLLMFLSSVLGALGALGVLASVICMVIVGIVKLVYLFQTASIFRQYTAQ